MKEFCLIRRILIIYHNFVISAFLRYVDFLKDYNWYRAENVSVNSTFNGLSNDISFIFVAWNFIISKCLRYVDVSWIYQFSRRFEYIQSWYFQGTPIFQRAIQWYITLCCSLKFYNLYLFKVCRHSVNNSQKSCVLLKTKISTGQLSYLAFHCLSSEHSWWISPSINSSLSSFQTWTVPPYSFCAWCWHKQWDVG